MLQIEVISDLAIEPVSLQEAKEFLSIDYNDFDTLLGLLITASRKASEKVSGKAYGAKIIQVTGNSYDGRTGDIERIYPITPYVSNVVWDGEDETGNVDYRYNAGFTTCPQDLKIAILMRVATGFAVRQNGISEAINKAVNSSIITEKMYNSNFVV